MKYLFLVISYLSKKTGNWSYHRRGIYAALPDSIKASTSGIPALSPSGSLVHLALSAIKHFDKFENPPCPPARASGNS